MALTQTWVLQGTSPTTLEATDLLQFCDGTFDNPITVSAYNGSTHVRSSIGADDSTGNTPNNVKFISQTRGGDSDSQADWGDGTEDIDAILEAECTLKLTVAFDSNITVTDITMYGYDGTTTTDAPVGLDLFLAELADIVFTNADGSASALTITDSDTPATSHDFFILASASPSAVGVKDANKIRVEFTYQ